MADTKSASAMPLPDAVAGNFQEAARWFNQMWGGAGDAAAAAARGGGPIPSVLMPTLDIKELDKRIADLRSVEHWLQLNQGLLQTTIQGLEMQRNTLAAWQSFGTAAAGATGTAAGAGTAAAPAAAGGGAAAELPPFQPALWWAALQQQFSQMAAATAASDSARDRSPAAGAAADRDTPPDEAAKSAGKGRAAGSGGN